MGASASELADQGHVGVRQTPLGGVQKFLHVRVSVGKIEENHMGCVAMRQELRGPFMKGP